MVEGAKVELNGVEWNVSISIISRPRFITDPETIFDVGIARARAYTGVISSSVDFDLRIHSRTD